jgi:UDP-N-acetylmuramate dehydrogenase
MLAASVIDELKAALGPEGVREREPMSAHTTFRIGGPADALVHPASVPQVQEVVRICHAAGVKLWVIGCGSDLLVADGGLTGVVMEVGERLSRISVDGCRMTVQAGATNAAVSAVACAHGLSGYEFACGIPGTVGGAAIMNAGAYDGEFADVARELVCVDAQGALVRVTHDQADWGYRHSMMDDAGLVVVEAVLELVPASPADVQAKIDDLTQRRTAKQPLDLPSAGSTFKRPEGYFAGKLIQDAGLRGYRVGGAQVSEKHTGFVVNAGGATAADVRQLIADVQDRVRASQGVDLHPEVRMWGFDA